MRSAPIDRDVHFVADDHAQRRRALQSVGLDVPAGAAQQLVPRRRERREVRHVAAGHEADAAVGGEAEQIEQPRGGHFLDHGGRGRHDVQRRRLIPHAGEPFRGDRRRQRAAGDEPEIPRAGRRHEAGFGRARERVDDVGGIDG